MSHPSASSPTPEVAPRVPITSKLAVIAERMDMFTRLENEALSFSLHAATQEAASLNHQLQTSRALANGLLNRVQELSLQLELEFDRNDRLVNRIVELEQSVLACPGHEARSRHFTISQPRRVLLGQHRGRRTRRRLDFEFVDLTTESEGETTNEEE